MKKILLPTDFSEISINAMRYAVQLFKNKECLFYVLNTFTPVAFYTESGEKDPEEKDMDIGQRFEYESQQKVDQVITALSSEFENELHTFLGISIFSSLTGKIKTMVKNHGIELIVMGTKGMTGLKEIFIGSETMHVIKNATIPVIGVPQAYTYTQPKNILFTTDYKSGAAQKGLSLLEEIADDHISRVIFLNVFQGESLTDKQKENMGSLDNFFKDDAHLTQIATGMTILDAIKDFDSRHPIDLITMVHHRHNFFENLLFTPVVQKIVHHSVIPFMILPPLTE